MLLEHSIPVNVSEDFLNKVKYLCAKIPDEEWSGVLYYTIQGSIANLTEFAITLKDIFPMDKGSSAHTAFEYGEDIVEYQMSNPSLNIMPKGLIHSHNKMQVFFSGEDQSEIQDNAQFYNYYLSVVVNNKLELAMRLSFEGSVTVTGKDEKGQLYTISAAEKILFVYPCHLVDIQTILPVGQSFVNRVAHLIQKHLNFKRSANKARIVEPSFYPQRQFDNTPYKPKEAKGGYCTSNRNSALIIEDDTDERNLEEFVIQLLLSKVPNSKADTLGYALSILDKFFGRNTVNITDFCRSIVEKFFVTHFAIYGEVGTEDMMEDFTDIELLLLDYVPEYSFVQDIINALAQLAFSYQLLESDEQNSI